MKVVIRRSVFETNSSSCHSISLGKGNIKPNVLIPDDEGNIIVETDEFGWEYDTFTEAYIKLSYLATYIYNRKYLDITPEIVEKYYDSDLNILDIKAFDDETTEKYLNMLCDVIREVTGGKLIIKSNTTDITNFCAFGYIDHQSMPVAAEIFENNKIKEFIFNPKSILTTDNDNH